MKRKAPVAQRWGTNTGRAGRVAGDEPQPDRGCHFAPKCISCPWVRCLLTESREADRRELAQALRVVRRHMAPPDSAIVL
jgi:hypothetical protein